MNTPAPSVIHSFASLGLLPVLCNALEKAGVTRPTLVQQEAIPPILAGHDVLLSGQTGSGKTAAFVLPALQRLASIKEQNDSESPKHRAIPRLLILEPTRDLAMQTAGVCRQLGRQLPIRTRVVCGGISREEQCLSLQDGADIIVATHGRLLDLVTQGDLILSEIIMLVLDEADRLLDDEFSDSMTALVPYLADRPQTIFCSATLPDSVMALAHRVTRHPVRLTLAEESLTPRRIRQRALFLNDSEKDTLTRHILTTMPTERSLLFVRTKGRADTLASTLRHEGFRTAALHGGHTQGSRKTALTRFQNNEVDILVTTDIAARGLDLDDVMLVLNVDMPTTAETYIHRIGRTARAGKKGHALSLVTPAERGLLREIERRMRHRIRIVTPETLMA